MHTLGFFNSSPQFPYRISSAGRLDRHRSSCWMQHHRLQYHFRASPAAAPAPWLRHRACLYAWPQRRRSTHPLLHLRCRRSPSYSRCAWKNVGGGMRRLMRLGDGSRMSSKRRRRGGEGRFNRQYFLPNKRKFQPSRVVLFRVRSHR